MKKLNKICLRTKIEAIVAVSILLILVVASASSITRTISNSGDNVVTFIRNSKGNCWEATGSNIQVAINDLDGQGGTVWVPGGTTYTITNTIMIRRNIVLEAYSATLLVTANVNAIQMRPYSKLIGCIIDTSGYGRDYDKSAIYLDGVDQFNTWKTVTVYDVQIKSSTMGWDYANNGSGIHIDCVSDESLKNCYSAHFQNMWIMNFKYGIYLESGKAGDVEGGACCGNIFDTITFHNCKYAIYLSKLSGSTGTDGNIFSNYMIQPYAAWKVEDVHIEGDYNIFYGFVFDANGVLYHLMSNANHNRIIEGGAMTIQSSQYEDEGAYNAVMTRTLKGFNII